MQPLISVIIPSYNREDYLRKTLDSLNKQTFKNYELIIVDDCSTDNSINVAKKYTDKIIKNKKNLGVATSRNLGIKAAYAQLIAFIDSDCIADKFWLEKLYNEIINNDAPVITGKVIIPKSTFIGDCISALGFPGGGHVGFEKMWRVSREGYTEKLATGNSIIKKEIFKKYGPFDTSFPYGSEDSEFSFRLTANGIKIKYLDSAIIYHEPRTSLISFIKWQLYRGKGNYYFKKKVGNIGGFIKLRVWSSKNIIKKYLFSFKIFVIIPLLFLSFCLQQYGFIQAKIKDKKSNE